MAPAATPASSDVPRPAALVGATVPPAEAATEPAADSPSVLDSSPPLAAIDPAATPHGLSESIPPLVATASSAPADPTMSVVAPAPPQVPGEATETPAISPALLTLDTFDGMALPLPKSETFRSLPPKPVHIRSTDSARPPRVGPVRPEHRPAFKLGLVSFFLVAACALGVGGYFAFQTFRDLRPQPHENGPVKKPTVAATKTATPPVSLAAPDIAPPTPASQGGRLIQAAKKMSAKNQDEVMAIIDAGQSTPLSLPIPLPQVSAPQVAAPQPGPTAQADPTAPPEASMAFFSFAESLKVNGVFQGNPARAHLNGRTYRAGALIDATIGIFFDGVDPARREIILKDYAGATLRKKY